MEVGWAETGLVLAERFREGNVYTVTSGWRVVQKQVPKSRAVDIIRVIIVLFNITDMPEKAEPIQEDRRSGGFKHETACGQYFTDKTNRVTAGNPGLLQHM